MSLRVTSRGLPSASVLRVDFGGETVQHSLGLSPIKAVQSFWLPNTRGSAASAGEASATSVAATRPRLKMDFVMLEPSCWPRLRPGCHNGGLATVRAIDNRKPRAGKSPAGRKSRICQRSEVMAAAEMIELWRGGLRESVHRGHAVVWDRGGMVAAWGDPAAVIFPRSSCKMIQALPL